MKRDEFKGLRGQSFGDKRVQPPEQESIGSMLAGIVVALLALALLIAIGNYKRAHGQDAITATFGPPTKPAPEDPRRIAKRELGKLLFSDPRVGTDFRQGVVGTSCATCHRLDRGTTDGRKLAVGRIGSRQFPEGRTGNRKTPPVLNVGFRGDQPMFWDGRALNLADQALGPVANPDEMGNQTTFEMCDRLNRIAGYAPYVKAAFATKEDPEPILTPERFAAAIAQFEVDVLVAVDTPLTRYFGGDQDALTSESAKRGAKLFKTHCAVCHPAPLYTSGIMANTGVELLASTNDQGLEKTTGDRSHRRAFKAPGLVHIHTQAPYCHNGAIPTLERMVAHYGAGGAYVAKDGQRIRDKFIDPRVAKISLNAAEQADLVTCLYEGLPAYDYPRPERVIPREFPK